MEIKNNILPQSALNTFFRNVKSNLLTKNKFSIKDILTEFSETIISASFELNKESKKFIVIPLVVFKNESEEPVIIHSGDYRNITLPSKQEEGILFKTKERLLEYCKNVIDEGKDDVNEKNNDNHPMLVVFRKDYSLGEKLEIDKYSLPGSLRRLKGQIKFDLTFEKGSYQILFGFLLVDKKSEDDRFPELDPSDKEKVNIFFENLIFYYKEGVDYFRRFQENDNEAGVYFEKLDYPGLRNQLNSLYREIYSLGMIKPITELSLEQNEIQYFKELFKVFFVIPIIDTSGELKFRYVFTSEQINRIKNIKFEPDIQTFIKKYEDKTKSEFARGCKEKYGLESENFEDIFKQLINKFDNITIDTKNENLLRQALFIKYAFDVKTITEFVQNVNSLNDLIKEVECENGYVKPEEAFLITFIFSSGHPDIVGSFIKHPYSRFILHPTKKLIEDILVNKIEFYPRLLHLFEFIFFPKRMMMFPIYENNSPLLLCAFDANELEHRESIQSVVNKYKGGFLQLILEEEYSEAVERFSNAISKENEEEFNHDEFFHIIIKRLLFHFVKKIDTFEKDISIDISDFNSPLDKSKKNKKHFELVELKKRINVRCKKGNSITDLFSLTLANKNSLFYIYLNKYDKMFNLIRQNNDLLIEKTKQKSSKIANALVHDNVQFVNYMKDDFLELLSNYENYNDAQIIEKIKKASNSLKSLSHNFNSSKVISDYRSRFKQVPLKYDPGVENIYALSVQSIKENIHLSLWYLYYYSNYNYEATRFLNFIKCPIVNFKNIDAIFYNCLNGYFSFGVHNVTVSTPYKKRVKDIEYLLGLFFRELLSNAIKYMDYDCDKPKFLFKISNDNSILNISCINSRKDKMNHKSGLSYLTEAVELLNGKVKDPILESELWEISINFDLGGNI